MAQVECGVEHRAVCRPTMLEHPVAVDVTLIVIVMMQWKDEGCDACSLVQVGKDCLNKHIISA